MPISFRRYAWFTLFYTVAVIVWGAYVRATGAGAGCGSHWPLCNGVILPIDPGIKTIIEFSHRLSSGLNMILVCGLGAWAWRLWPAGHRVRKAAVISVGLIFLEAIIGAGLVLLALVEHDQSVRRAISISMHLTNTLFLIAALTLTAYWASRMALGREANLEAADAGPLSVPVPRKIDREFRRRAYPMIAAFFILAMMGALTALGDTLFPAVDLSGGMAQDLSLTAHFLIRLRIFHPVMALIVGMALVPWSEKYQEAVDFAGPGRLGSAAPDLTTVRAPDCARPYGRWLKILFFANWAVGLSNIALLAPVSLQLFHLGMANLIWISLVLFLAQYLELT